MSGTVGEAIFSAVREWQMGSADKWPTLQEALTSALGIPADTPLDRIAAVQPGEFVTDEVNKTIGECVEALDVAIAACEGHHKWASAEKLRALADALERCESPVCSVDSLVVLKPGQHVVGWCDPLPLGVNVKILDSERDAIEVMAQGFTGGWLVVRSAGES